jgi:uncharacterized protein YcaQ
MFNFEHSPQWHEQMAEGHAQHAWYLRGNRYALGGWWEWKEAVRMHEQRAYYHATTAQALRDIGL